MYVAPTIEAGVYNNVAVTISDMVTWEMTESITAQITINEEKGGALSAHIEAYATDYKCYVVDMKFEIPTPTKTVNVSFNNSSRATFIPQNDNMLQLLNYGDDYEASMTVFGIKPGDTFTMDNVYLDYSGIYDANEQFTIAVADIQGVLNQKGDTTYINASVIGFNAVQYDLELWYTVPTPVDTVEIEMPVDFSNALYDGYYTLSAYTPDSLWYVAISPMTDEVAGTFVNDGMFGRFGTEGGEYDFFSGNTFIFSGKELKNFTVEKGTLVVEMAADSTIFAEAKLIASNAKYYHIKMTSGYNTHLDYDEPFMEVDRTYTSLDNVTIDDQSEQYGYIYLELTAADNSDVAAFFFYVEEADEETIVPVGVYPIDYSEEYGTVAANPGIQGNGVWPSFYAEKADGGLAVPLWLLVGGTVEVSKDEAGNPRLEVNAYNSYGVKVHIVYEVLANGLENIDVENIKGVKKIIKENQLYILRDGKAYNIVGAQIK